MFIETISYQSATVIQRLRADQSLKTDLANLRQTTSLLELIFEHTNTAYMFVDSSLRIFKINKAFCKIFNIPNAEIPIGANYQDYFKLSAPLFMDLIKFLTEIESLIIESKTVHNQKLTMSNGDILELDFIPIIVLAP